MQRGFNLRDFDWFLLLLALGIAATGVVEIYSTTAHTALAAQYKRQIYWILLGCLAALAICRLDYHLILEHIPGIYLLTLLALVVVLFAGQSISGARRWLRFGPLTFQVSEVAKLVIMLVVAGYLAGKREKFVTWKDLAALSVLVGLPAALVAIEPDLGTALTFVPIAVSGLFLAGMRGRQVFALLLVAILTLPVGWHFLKPYQRERVTAFVHPSENVQGSGYQVSQAKIAIGSGGFWGKGIGNGTQSRLGFIPVSRADFVFASYAEEQGFVGTLLVLLLYFALLLRLLEGAQTAGDRAGAFLLVGIASVLFFQVAVNIGMMIGLLPITGIPLPLMSQGGSSTLVTFVALGLAMSVKMRRFVN
ncbi:MAG TPA: rod shape-determining protein RodA [Terriglobia bacterium]|nr:rod shape-determining protein RodA [Terriglobia bacterium]